MGPSRAVWLVCGFTVATLLAHVYIVSLMDYFIVIDEPYYLLLAHYILSGTVCVPPVLQPPYSCNFEHPPLAKALIALGISILGDNTYGWRISSVLCGTLCIPLAYLIALKLSDDKKLSLFAAGFLALDTLLFAESNAAMLDVPELFFGLVAFAVYLYGFRIGAVNRYLLSGLVLGASILSKETGIFLLCALVTYHVLFTEGPLSGRLRAAAEVVGASFVAFAVGLQAYDSVFTTYPAFYDQVLYILKFGSSLTSRTPLPILSILSNSGLAYNFVIYAQGGCGSCARSGPLDWITFYYPIDFQAIPFENFNFYMAADVPVVWSLYVWVPLTFVHLRKSGRRVPAGPQRLAAFALVWFLWNFVPYVVLYGFGRFMFVWYLIPAVPALSMGAAYLVTRARLPRPLLVAYVAVIILWFFIFFPAKGFAVPPL